MRAGGDTFIEANPTWPPSVYCSIPFGAGQECGASSGVGTPLCGTGHPTSSERMHVSIGLRKSTSPQKRQFNISTSHCKQSVDSFVGEGGVDFLKVTNEYIL